MDTLIDQIRAAIADDADDDAQQAGASACRSILATLDARRAPATDTSPAPSPAPRSVGELPALVAIRAMPRTQILDYVIEKLRALQPEAQTNVSVMTAISALRGLSLDQLVDFGVARLKTALAPPPVVAPALPEGTRVIRLAPVPRSRRE